jgi:hypothetical protein
MNRSWPMSLVFVAGVLISMPGCLVTHHSQNIIREKEARRSVHFESEEAQQMFNTQVAETKAKSEEKAKSRSLTIPFLLSWSTTDVLSDAALYNDQLAACDANADGIITMHEVMAYCGRSREEAANIAGSKPGRAEARSSVQAASAHQPLESPPMPNGSMR